MRNEFTAIIEQDGEWYIAYSPEILGANGQGRTSDEARDNLGDAIALIEVDEALTESVLEKVRAIDGISQAKALSF